MKTSIVAAVLGVSLLVSGAAFATDAAAPAASPSPMAAAKPDKAAIQARSQECSKEAEVQGLKGHKRKVFLEKCKRGAN
jgi:hypothetical protein